MVAWRYGISLLVFNSISHSFATLTREISRWTLDEKFHISTRPCIIVYFQREICRYDTFKLLSKTLLKKLLTNKGEILSCKSVKPYKNRKNLWAYYVRTRDKSGSNSPPFRCNVQIPPSPGTMDSRMPGVCPGGGGDVEVSNWLAH